jgi:hypothetical protein
MKKFTMRVIIEDSCARYEYVFDNPGGKGCIQDYAQAISKSLNIECPVGRFISMVPPSKKGTKNARRPKK